MRVINFRLWDKKLCVMWQPIELQKLLSYILFQSCPNADAYLEMKDHFEEMVWLQSIGQSDQHGTEIFEGDIVTGSFSCSKGTAWMVEYLDGAFQFLNIHDSTDGALWPERVGPLTVIGNIYENSDPLGAK